MRPSRMRLSRLVATSTGLAMALGVWAAPGPLGSALAQNPAGSPAGSPADSSAGTPAQPQPPAPAQAPAPAPTTTQAPAPAPAQASPQAAPAPAPAQDSETADDVAPPATGGEVFGEEVTLPERTIVAFSGTATWDKAFDSIKTGLKAVNDYLKKENISATGPAMTIYTSTDDSGFNFKVGVPVAQAPSTPPQVDLSVGPSPSGKALKYVHRGSYDSMDTTYEAITNQLDDKDIDAQDSFVEVYDTDPLTTPEDELLIEVFVPLK